MRMNIGENAQMALATLRENKMRSFLTVSAWSSALRSTFRRPSILVGVYGDVNAYLSDTARKPSSSSALIRHPTGRLTPEERARKPLSPRGCRSHRAILSCGACGHGECLSPFLRSKAPLAAHPPALSQQGSFGIDTMGRFPPPKKFSIPGQNTDGSSATRKICIAPTWPLSAPILPKLCTRTWIRSEKPIQVDGVSYEVIGVLEPRKGQLVKDQSADKAVMVPYRTYHKTPPQDDENLLGAVAYRASCRKPKIKSGAS